MTGIEGTQDLSVEQLRELPVWQQMFTLFWDGIDRQLEKWCDDGEDDTIDYIVTELARIAGISEPRVRGLLGLHKEEGESWHR